jgi:hypothetical protein
VSDTSKLDERGYAETEISLADIVDFIQDGWKQLVLAGIVGALLGFSNWHFFGSYKTELHLFGNANGLDLPTWRILEASLPDLARKIVAEDNFDAKSKGFYVTMSDPQWWVKSVTPKFLTIGVDNKGLRTSSKDLDTALSRIISFTFTISDPSKESSLENAFIASKFLRSGGAYLELKSLLNRYEVDTITLAVKIQGELAQIQDDQIYQRARIKNLEDLQKRFPSSSLIVANSSDSNINSLKQLPINNQLIAAISEFNQTKETVIRLNSRLVEIKIVKQFLDQAILLTKNQFDGFFLVKNLFTIQEKLRDDLLTDDYMGRFALDKIRLDLLAIEVRYLQGFESGASPIVKKTGILKATLSGLAIAGFLMLMYLLGRRSIGILKLKK